MQPLLQRVEIEAPLGADDDLAVDDAALGQDFAQRFGQLGKVTVERPQVAALDHHLAALAEHDGAEAIPFRFEQESVAVGKLIRNFGKHRLDRRHENDG